MQHRDQSKQSQHSHMEHETKMGRIRSEERMQVRGKETEPVHIQKTKHGNRKMEWRERGKEKKRFTWATQKKRKLLTIIGFQKQNMNPKVHHSNKAIRFGDHSPENLIVCGGLRNSTKGWRKRERERNPHSQKERKSNKHETLYQALELCHKIRPVHYNYYYYTDNPLREKTNPKKNQNGSIRPKRPYGKPHIVFEMHMVTQLLWKKETSIIILWTRAALVELRRDSWWELWPVSVIMS